MIKCNLCKIVARKGESTGKFRTYGRIKPKGKKIIRESIVCMNCNGENLLK